MTTTDHCHNGGKNPAPLYGRIMWPMVWCSLAQLAGLYRTQRDAEYRGRWRACS
jgi:hypothetical protein